MFTDKIELKDFDKMDPEYKDLLGRVLTIQADCEIGGPHLYVEKMLPAAPTKLDQLIVARTAAEEIDHFRKVARVAGDIGVDVSFVLSQPNEKRFVDTFRGSITTWEDNAVFGFLIERGNTSVDGRAHEIPSYRCTSSAAGALGLVASL